MSNSDTDKLVSRNQSPLKSLSIRYQAFLDNITGAITGRWIFTIISLLLFIARILTVQGWYIIAYGLGIYLLNLFLAFLSPKFEPEIVEEDEDGPGLLPVNNDDDFKPFIRRLPEFKFWLNSTYAILISISCTFFSFLDVPVFWPILLFYWVFLVVLTMRRQIAHMIKYKYIPFSNYGKKRYTNQ